MKTHRQKMEYQRILKAAIAGLILVTAIRSLELPVQAAESQQEQKIWRVGVVGDTGIGERAYHPGFLAVMEAMKKRNPDVLLHLGDFVYQPRMFPQNCPSEYMEEIQQTLVEPFRYRIFVPGDNDLPPHKRKPKASGCWSKIDPLDTSFDPVATNGVEPGPYEGTRVVGNLLFAVLNTYPWKDPTPWLKRRIEQARRDGFWIIIALHEPPLTTAWFLDKRNSVLKQVNALGPDLVFSGNQHSYERFHPMGVPGPQGTIPFQASEPSVYKRGDGAIHIVSGGGGATFKPFADMQGRKEQTAPREVFDALAVRALMNHFIILESGPELLTGTVYRVCPSILPDDSSDPRWRSGHPMWDSITLECDGKPPGVTVFDRFEIHR